MWTNDFQTMKLPNHIAWLGILYFNLEKNNILSFLFMKSLLGAQYEPNAMLYFGDTVVNKTDKVPACSTQFSWIQLESSLVSRRQVARLGLNTPRLAKPALPLSSFEIMNTSLNFLRSSFLLCKMRIVEPGIKLTYVVVKRKHIKYYFFCITIFIIEITENSC